MFQQRRQHTIVFAKICERQKKSYRVSPFPRQELSYQRNGKNLKLMTRKLKSTEPFKKQRNSDLKRLCRDIKKITWRKWRLSAYTKGAIRQPQRQLQMQTQKEVQKQSQKQVQRQSQRLLGVDTTFCLIEQLGKMTEEEQKNYRSIVSRR